MDAFQIRLDFLAILKRLNASQQSMQKTLTFADRNVKAAGDLWDCILSECSKTNLSSRLNILFTLDYLFTDYSTQFSRTLVDAFLNLAARDLSSLIDYVVPPSDATGIKLNSAVTTSILTAWRVKRLFSSEQINSIVSSIQKRKEKAASDSALDASKETSSASTNLSKDEIMRRIEEDRERHKRIREKIWVLPPKSFLNAVPDSAFSSASSSASSISQRKTGPPMKRQRLDTNILTPPSPTVDSNPSAKTSESTNASTAATSDTNTRPDPTDIEFEDLWETTSDLNEDDFEAWNDEVEERWWGGEKAQARQLKMRQDRDNKNKTPLPKQTQPQPQAQPQPQIDTRMPPPSSSTPLQPPPPSAPPPPPPVAPQSIAQEQQPPPRWQQRAPLPPQTGPPPTGPSNENKGQRPPPPQPGSAMMRGPDDGYRNRRYQQFAPPRRPRAGGRW
ncbi:unnamed protein product [Sympodiomycopsis kandeliae]